MIFAGFFWRTWLPGLTEFTLEQHRSLTARRLLLTVLKNTDPVMRGIGKYLVPDFTEGFDENFLFFISEETKKNSSGPDEPETENDAIRAVNISALSGIYTQVNGTAIANATDFEVEDYLDQTVEMPQFTAGKPSILIYHTHTTECYRNEDGITNSRDPERNVVAVGEAMAKVFRAAGYETIHITEIFNEPDFMSAYSTARKTVEKVLKENPTVQVVLDIHRDSISEGGVDYYPVTEIEGGKAAQVMIVCGTDAKGLDHPDWPKNFAYGLAVSRKMGELYGQLSRPVNLRRDRFNTHFTPYTLLLEVGSSANTLDQAKLGAECTARAMIALWNE